MKTVLLATAFVAFASTSFASESFCSATTNSEADFLRCENEQSLAATNFWSKLPNIEPSQPVSPEDHMKWLHSMQCLATYDYDGMTDYVATVNCMEN